MKTNRKLLATALLWTAFVVKAGAADGGAWRAALERRDVSWQEPSKDSLGSTPLGNGDIGVNVWVEPGGDLLFYLSKTDAWSENAQLLKLGRVRVHLSPNPFQPGQPFQQRLRLATGEIAITAGAGTQTITLRVWVDANDPVVQVDMEGQFPFNVQADLEVWRTARRELKGQDRDPVYGLYEAPTPVFAEPDDIADGGPDRVVWYHRNERSIWADNLKLQALGDLTRTLPDPLLHRTFGGTLRGDGLARLTPTSLKSKQPLRRCRITVTPLTAQTETSAAWLQQMADLTKQSDTISTPKRLSAHRRWWAEFWNRSWIYVSGDAQAEHVTRGYALQRFINACAGRGALPIKFNGSIFTMDATVQGQ